MIKILNYTRSLHLSSTNRLLITILLLIGVHAPIPTK